MLLIGKPGSGKTTLLKQLLTNPQMYMKKFDEILLISPSYAKMGLQIKEENVRSKFSLDWIFQKLDSINEDQIEKTLGHSLGGRRATEDKFSATGQTKLTNSAILGDQRSRFDMGQFTNRLGFANETLTQEKKSKQQQQHEEEEKELQYQKRQQQMYKDLQQLSFQEQQEKHVDILIVLDDVVSSIKKCEYDPRLAQLIMNRRHLVFNGTVSIIIVSQKYTLIPVRLRSNANWLIVYQLNPIDFDNIYKDIIIHDMQTWRRVLQFVFGNNFDGKEGKILDDNEQTKQSFTDFMKNKKFENLGIWVEFNVYFKNFKRIMM